MSDARLTPAVELDGLSPDEAFAVLGNEIRLDMLRVLWRADAAHQYDEVSDVTETVPFTDLRRGVDVDDNAKFNYHLSKLVPQFVRGPGRPPLPMTAALLGTGLPPDDPAIGPPEMVPENIVECGRVTIEDLAIDLEVTLTAPTPA